MSRSTPSSVSRLSVILTSATLLLASASAVAFRSPAASGSPSATGVAMALPLEQNITWMLPVSPLPEETQANAWAANLLYQPLLRLNGNGSINWRASLANHIRFNAQGTQYTITINPHWRWSNGTPVTAADVVFTWQLLSAASGAHVNRPWPYYDQGNPGMPSDVRSVVAPNAQTVVVTLTQPMNQTEEIYNGLSQLVPLPPVWNHDPHDMAKELTWVANTATQLTAPAYQVVDGPYRLARATTNTWQFTANPHYSGHHAAIPQFTFVGETSASAEYAALQTGAIQVGALPSTYTKLLQHNAVDTLQTDDPLQFNYVMLNMNQGATQTATAPDGVATIFQSLAVRQALQMGINQAAINRAAYGGTGLAEVTALTSKPPSIFTPPALRPLYPYNPAKGRALLETQGWHLQHGVMTKGHQRLAFVLQYASNTPAIQEQVELIQEGWAKEGVQLTLRPAPIGTLVAENPDQWTIMDFGGIAYGGTYPSGASFFDGVGADLEGYHTPGMTQIIAKTLRPYPTTQASLAALNQYFAYVAKELPVLWVPAGPSDYAIARGLHGAHPILNPFTDDPSPQTWYR